MAPRILSFTNCSEKTLPLWRIGPWRELASWSPASKLTQALYPLKERHLYRNVTSGRLGAKRLRLSEYLSEEIFRVVGGNSNITGFWFVIVICFPQKGHSQQKKKKKNNIVTIYEYDSSCKVTS